MRTVEEYLNVAVVRTIREYYSGNALYFGQALVAFAQLSVLVFTDSDALFQDVVGKPTGPLCQGIGRYSLYCLPGTESSPEIAGAVCGLFLILVISGWRPRVTGLLHVWVSLSMATSFTLPDGGDSIALVAGIVMLPLNLIDSRKWQWQGRFMPPRPVGQGWAWATIWALRIQVAYIYLHAAVSKGGVSEWVDGSAMFYITRDPYFGAEGILGNQFKWVANSPIGTYALSWSGILIEAIIAILLFSGRRARRIAVLFDLAFHGAIILAMGLWSFSLVMIGVVLAATGGWGRSSPSIRTDESVKCMEEKLT